MCLQCILFTFTFVCVKEVDAPAKEKTAATLRILWPVVSRNSLEINKKEVDEDRQGRNLIGNDSQRERKPMEFDEADR